MLNVWYVAAGKIYGMDGRSKKLNLQVLSNSAILGSTCRWLSHGGDSNRPPLGFNIESELQMASRQEIFAALSVERVALRFQLRKPSSVMNFDPNIGFLHMLHALGSCSTSCLTPVTYI